MIRVLIVEDSPVVSQMLSYILSSDPDIKVVGIATNGEEAIRMTVRLKPDVVTMDIVMPGMDGYEATRKIMETTPVPIVIVSSSYNYTEVAKSFKALEAGALAMIAKPVGIGHPLFEKHSSDLINTIKTLSTIKMGKYKRRIKPDKKVIVKKEIARQEIRMIAIGASTGGPPVLQTILSGLPKNLPVPVAIVQHITQGFTAGFTSWLSDVTGFNVCVPENGEICIPGKVYVAPDNAHMVFDYGGRILLNNDPPDNLLKPSVAHLFISVANVFREKAVGVLLSGMGRDGAEGLKMMRDMGAVTIAQDEESSVVFGMNGEAVRLGAARYVLSPEDITQMLIHLISGK